MPEFDHTRSLRILLADEHLVSQKLALLMLKRLGYRADVAAGELDVLAALQRQPYDVVLLDVPLSEGDGLEIVRQCHQWHPHPRPYLIALTANAMQNDREICLKAGIDYYMSKPLCLEELAQVLSQCKPLKPSITSPDIASPSIGSPDIALPVNVEPPASCIPSDRDRAALDLTVLAAFCREMGDTGRAVIIELIDCYVTEAPEILQAIEIALRQGDRGAMHRAAHGLKASSASLGALCLSQLCQALESTALSASIDQLTDVFAYMKSEYERVEVALKHEQLQ